MNLGNQFHGSSVPLVNQVNESKGPLPGPLFMCLGISGFWIISDISDITQSTSTQACLLLLSLLQKTTIHRLWCHCSLPRAVKFLPRLIQQCQPFMPYETHKLKEGTSSSKDMMEVHSWTYVKQEMEATVAHSHWRHMSWDIQWHPCHDSVM